MENLILINTKTELNDLILYLQDKEYIAVDTETTGLEKDAKIIGLSVCAELDTAYYIILYRWDNEQQKLIENTDLIKNNPYMDHLLTTLSHKKLIMHNAIFDCKMVMSNFGYDLMPTLHTDTMILGHLLNENRHNGLKELGISIFGEDAANEQKEMKESVTRNGGLLTKKKFELYKADADLIGKYGAKDTLLTLKLFYHFVPLLYEENLQDFFYNDESMPLLRGPTYDLNSTGLNIDTSKLQQLRRQLEVENMELRSFIYSEINTYVKSKYPATNIKNSFNIDSPSQLSWLLFDKLDIEFNTLTKEGRNICKALNLKLPYSFKAKREFIYTCRESKGQTYFDYKSKKHKKVRDFWNYLSSDKLTLKKYAIKHKWIQAYLDYAKNLKILNTYVIGIQERLQYGVIYPSFLQHGTTSGRYSSRDPNFQNLPRDDKRIKSCIVARPGQVFVGADYSQLEPRVFASFSGDKRLLDCFKNGDDFYSVIGTEVFDKLDVSLKKDEENSFAKKYPALRNYAKTIALSAAYGTTPFKMASAISLPIEQTTEIIENYFLHFPGVLKLMLESHEMSKTNGKVVNLFGRPRRMSQALDIPKIFGNRPHSELPYEYRNLLNLAINHRIQSTGASIMNRAAISVWHMFKKAAVLDPRWHQVKLVLQVHDEIVAEGPEELAQQMVEIIKLGMEKTVILPGVDLIAEPKIGKTLADLK